MEDRAPDHKVLACQATKHGKDGALDNTHRSSDQRNLFLPVRELRGFEELIRDQYDREPGGSTLSIESPCP